MDKSIRHKLQLIANKTPRVNGLKSSQTMRSVLDDLMIDEMSNTLSAMHRLDNSSFEHDIGDGIVLSLMREQTRWLYRLETIWGMLTQLNKQNSLQGVLRADGWVISGGRLKTPAWLNDHAEISLDKLNVEYKRHLS